MNHKVIETNQLNFQKDVIQHSYQEPVIVDFWAPWCGPCRMLGPILERVANEPHSGFMLAKVNSDQNPSLSQQFNVRGIPAVKAFVNGRVVDEFVGAQPEPVVRQFAQRINAGFSPENNQQSKNSSSPPMSFEERLKKARNFLENGDGCKAQHILENYPSGTITEEVQGLKNLALFMCSSGTNRAGSANLQTTYNQAARALNRREPSAALYHLLVAYNQEESGKKDHAKAIMNGIFILLGEDNLLTKQYKALIR